MIFPSHVTSYKAPGASSSGSESYTLDYSGLDEIRKRQNEASATNAGKYKALYDGDVGGSVSAGRRIRDLISSIGSIEPVRMASYSSNSSSNSDGPVIGGEHADLKYLEAMTKMAPAGGGGGGAGRAGAPVGAGIVKAPPQSQPRVNLPNAGAAKKLDKEKKPGTHLMTGEPPTFPYMT